MNNGEKEQERCSNLSNRRLGKRAEFLAQWSILCSPSMLGETDATNLSAFRGYPRPSQPACRGSLCRRQVDVGDGDDFVVTLGYSTIKGGAGSDTLIVSGRRSDVDSTFDSADVDGDDYRLVGDDNTVNFNKGDGQDVVGIGGAGRRDSATINIIGYTAGDGRSHKARPVSR